MYSNGIFHNIGNIRSSTSSEFILNCSGSHRSIGCLVGPITRSIEFMVINGTNFFFFFRSSSNSSSSRSSKFVVCIEFGLKCCFRR